MFRYQLLNCPVRRPVFPSSPSSRELDPTEAPLLLLLFLLVFCLFGFYFSLSLSYTFLPSITSFRLHRYFRWITYTTLVRRKVNLEHRSEFCVVLFCLPSSSCRMKITLSLSCPKQKSAFISDGVVNATARRPEKSTINRCCRTAKNSCISTQKTRVSRVVVVVVGKLAIVCSDGG